MSDQCIYQNFCAVCDRLSDARFENEFYEIASFNLIITPHDLMMILMETSVDHVEFSKIENSIILLKFSACGRFWELKNAKSLCSRKLKLHTYHEYS